MNKLGIGFIAIGFLGMAHQYLFCDGNLFTWLQFWHHENLVAVAFALGLGVLVGGHK